MRVVVTGATGTIGAAVAGMLRQRGDEVVALTRDPDRARHLSPGVEVHAWPRPTKFRPPGMALAGADAVVHLLGEPVAQRWTESAKREICESRVLSTRMLVAGLTALPADRRPRTLVSQPATGFYGPHGDRWVDEQSPAGADFLAGVVIAWEREALVAAGAAGARVVVARTGVVLSPEGGALAKMLAALPFSAPVGRSPAAISMSPGFTSTTSPEHCSTASTTLQRQARSTRSHPSPRPTPSCRGRWAGSSAVPQ